MASKVFLHNKKSGRTYVYHNVSYWDKDEKKPKSKRKCIGHVDPVTGEIVPNRKKGDKRKERPATQEAEHGLKLSPETEQAAVSPVCSVLDCGVTTLLNQIAKEIGLDTVLSRVFPQDRDAILTCAYYLLSEGQALSRAEQWTAHTLTPCGGVLSDQRISELLQRITPSLTEDFFKAWIDWNRSQEYYCMDITSVSSYSEMNHFVSYGYNRDGEDLPQINLLMVTGQVSHMPLFYRALPGSIRDLAPGTPVSVSFTADRGRDGAIFLHPVYSPLDVYVDGNLVYSFGREGTYPAFFTDPPTGAFIVPLPPPADAVENTEREILLEYRSPAARNAISLYAPIIGSEGEILSCLAAKYALTLLLSVCFLFMGLLLLSFSLFLLRFERRGKLLRYPGMLAFCAGLWQFGENPLAVCLTRRPSLMYLLAFVGLFTLVIPLYRQAMLILSLWKSRLLRFFRLLMEGSVLAALALQLAGIVPFSRSMYWFHFLLPLAVCVLAGRQRLCHWLFYRPAVHRHQRHSGIDQLLFPLFLYQFSVSNGTGSLYSDLCLSLLRLYEPHGNGDTEEYGNAGGNRPAGALYRRAQGKNLPPVGTRGRSAAAAARSAPAFERDSGRAGDRALRGSGILCAGIDGTDSGQPGCELVRASRGERPAVLLCLRGGSGTYRMRGPGRDSRRSAPCQRRRSLRPDGKSAGKRAGSLSADERGPAQSGISGARAGRYACRDGGQQL